jgi:pimeloyl-ACP methyl ester carboxylesterase
VTFREGFVEMNGVRLRYAEAGEGSPLVHLPGGPGLHLTPAHDLLCRQFRVVVLDAAPGISPTAVAQALTRLGIDRFDLLATADGAATALHLAQEAPERVRALVLEAPAAPEPPRLATPTLVLVGARDSGPAAAIGRLCKTRMPNSHLVFVYDAGAAIAADRPEAFAEVVADFLERGEAFVISRSSTVIHR